VWYLAGVNTGTQCRMASALPAKECQGKTTKQALIAVAVKRLRAAHAIAQAPRAL